MTIRKPLACLIFACSLAAQTDKVDLKTLEDRADTEFNRRDCAAAEKTYAEALQVAIAAGEVHRTGPYYIRIGNCRTRVGDFTAALEAYHHAATVAEAASDGELLAVSVHGAALQLMKLGRAEEALPLAQREYELAQKCGHPNHMSRAMWLLAVQDTAVGRIRDGLRVMTQALAISRTTGDVAMTGVLLDNLAINYLALGDTETAAHLQKEVLAIPVASLGTMATTYSVALNYNNLGEIQLKGGHPQDARRSFEKAVEGSTAPENYRVHMDALLNLAKMQNEAGQIAEADAGFREAVAIAESVKFPEQQTTAWQMRSDALLVRGDYKGASGAGAEALRIARGLSSPDRTWKALLSVGAAKAAVGDQVSARVSFEEALRIGETLRAQSPGEVSDLSRSFANLLPVYQASVRNLMDLRLPAEALRRAEQAKARVLMDILLRGGVDEGSAMTRAEAAEHYRLRKQLSSASAAASGASSPATIHAVEDAMVEFRQFRRTLYDNHPELAIQSADFEAASPDKLAALLPAPKTALLDYFFVPSGVALFVVRPGLVGGPRISAYFLPDPKHTLSAEARSFRERLASRDLDYKTAAQHLFHRLLSPAMADLAGTTDWIVSPDGALWDVPFEALVDDAGQYLIQTRSVTLTPSLTSALEIHERSRPPGATAIALLALGNPLPSPVPLPEAAREVAEIGSHFPRGSALVLTGAAATATQFRDKAPSARIIHLAAHAGLNDGDPLSSFVRLGAGGQRSGEDGMLTALAIMSMHLRAEMVVLSACETALGNTGPGEGMIGMGWALSAAGASSSVLSLWKVDSGASTDFMTSFYRILAAGGNSVSRSRALRQTGLAMLQSPAYRHPFYWAAFTLQGDGSPAQTLSAVR